MYTIHAGWDDLHSKGCRPVNDHSDLFQHVFREQNTYADSLAGRPYDRIRLHVPVLRMLLEGSLVCYFDGSFSREKFSAAAAWAIFIYNGESDALTLAMEGSWYIRPQAAIDSEVAASASLLDCLVALAYGRILDFIGEGRVPCLVEHVMFAMFSEFDASAYADRTRWSGSDGL